MRPAAILLLALLAEATTACGGRPRGATIEEQARSFDRDLLIAGIPARRFVDDRRAAVVVTATPVPEDDRHFLLHGSMGTAIAISHDGYWLTAAHVVDAGSPLLILRWRAADDPRAEQRSLGLTPAEVVWTGAHRRRLWQWGEPDADDADFAVLRTAAPCEAWCDIADPADVAPAATTVLSGVYLGPISAGAPTGCGFDYSAGTIDTVSRLDDRFMLVRATLPAHQGDSGAPLLLTNGRLAGIMTWLDTRFLFWGSAGHCVALLPDRRWLATIIDSDRERRRHQDGSR